MWYGDEEGDDAFLREKPQPVRAPVLHPQQQQQQKQQPTQQQQQQQEASAPNSSDSSASSSDVMSSEVVGDQQHKRDDSALTQLDGAQERPAAGAAAPAGLMPPPPTEVVAGVGAPPSPLAAGTGVASSPPASGTSALAGGARSATGSAVNTPARPAPKPGLLAQALAGHKAEPVGSQSPPASDFGLAEGESRDALLHPQRGQHAVSGIAQALSSQSLSDTLSGSVKTDVVRTGMRLVQAFLLEKTAYELLPESGKVVVLDIDLHVRSAFEAVAEHSITSALLWDSELGRYVGILSVSDFIFLLLRLRDTRDTRSIEDFTVREWRAMENIVRPLECISVDSTMLEAMSMLVSRRVHRLPILSDAGQNDVLCMATHGTILWHIVENFRGQTDLFKFTVEDLRIGTFGAEKIKTINVNTKLYDVFELLHHQKISAVPIVDSEGVVLDVYSKTDVVLLGYKHQYDLDLDVITALAERPREMQLQSLPTCRRDDTLKVVLERLAQTRVHRLVCVDAANRVDGIVSLQDVFEFFVRAPENFTPGRPS